MERREFIALVGMATAAMPARAQAGTHPPDSIAGRLIGTWSLISSTTTRPDGSIFDRWGAAPSGILMFDHGSNYAQIIIGSESKVFGAKVACTFGTYSVDEPQKVLLTHIKSSSAAKLTGVTQNRTILLLTPTEFKYSNPHTMLGATAEVLWKRIT